MQRTVYLPCPLFYLFSLPISPSILALPSCITQQAFRPGERFLQRINHLSKIFRYFIIVTAFVFVFSHAHRNQ
jgi:hypothetical protein